MCFGLLKCYWRAFVYFSFCHFWIFSFGRTYSRQIKAFCIFALCLCECARACFRCNCIKRTLNFQLFCCVFLFLLRFFFPKAKVYEDNKYVNVWEVTYCGYYFRLLKGFLCFLQMADFLLFLVSKCVCYFFCCCCCVTSGWLLCIWFFL